MLALIALLAWIAGLVLQMTSIREHASPSTTVALQADGVTNPDEYFSAIVDEFSEVTEGDASEDRTVPATENPARAGAEQQTAMTKTSGRSRAIGP